MKERLIRKMLLGFVLGALVENLISLIIHLASGYGFRISNPELVQSVGKTSAVVLQILLSGIYGAICIGGTEFFCIDSWGLLRSTFTHFICVFTSFIVTGLVLRWIHVDLFSCIFLAILVIAYFLIWLFMYLRWNKSIREMNIELEKYKKENSK